VKHRTLLVIFLVLTFGAIIFSQNRGAVSGAEVTGTFRYRNNEFKILALGKGKLKISFSGIYEYKYQGEPIANTGEGEGVADISGDTAVFTPEGADDCTITMKFLPNHTINVDQEGGGTCGFGAHVYATGVYRKVSSKRPDFSK
jgi:hypothetical protein